MTANKHDWIDYSHEVKPLANPLLRLTLIGFSFIFLSLGVIGIFLPVLPTTPFVLLAAICYARSSVKFYNWLMNHRWFGPHLRQWVETRSLTLRTKVVALSMLCLTLVPSIIWLVPIRAVQIALAVIGLSVALYIATRNTSRSPSKRDESA